MGSFNYASLIFYMIVVLFLSGGMVGLLSGRKHAHWAMRVALACACAGSLAAVVGVIAWNQSGGNYSLPSFTLDPPIVELPFGRSTVFPMLTLDFRLDGLASFFILLTGLLSAGVSLYSFVWLAKKSERNRIAGAYNLLVLSTLLVVVVNNAYYFLLFLECVTLTFSYLTLYKHNRLLTQEEGSYKPEELEASRLAFKAYLIFSHLGFTLITAAFILLGLAHATFNFDAWRNSSVVDHTDANVIFLLVFVGFGIKAAIAPWQSWMALTHPYLPTNIHAFVSSVVIKVVGLYGLIRVLFDFLPIASWWGWLVLLIAGVTTLVGVFYAITSRDLKTALANHSVENIGIILAGVGLAMVFKGLTIASLPKVDVQLAGQLATLALTAALFHLLNHSIFKSLLFLGTGAIEYRTEGDDQPGVVELDKLGGLIHIIPWTSATFLVGAVAIAGFPPFNGFISEWLLLQTTFASLSFFLKTFTPLAFTQDFSLPWQAIGLIATLLMLGLAFGMTALAFVKIAGEALLGPARYQEHSNKQGAHDVPWPMLSILIALAIACLLIGILPGWIFSYLLMVSQPLVGSQQSFFTGNISAIHLELSSNVAKNSIPLYQASLSLLPVLFLAAIPCTLAFLVTWRRRPKVSRKEWNGGTPLATSNRITGEAYSFLTWTWATDLSGRRRRKSSSEKSAKMLLIPWYLPMSGKRYVIEYFRWAINAFLVRVTRFSNRFGDWFQGGDIRSYLIYLFIAFILVLLLSIVHF